MAALEALIAAYAGPMVLANAAERYTQRTNSNVVGGEGSRMAGSCTGASAS